MTPEYAIDIGRQAVEMVLLLAAPMLLAGLVIGLMVSIFQAATQINEQTLTFVTKIVAVLSALLFFAPWMIRMMTTFTQEIITAIATVGS
ncbi:MAG TPA: flagellar biosynthesis protein FliQ [Thioalkalivibrio sp.]|nr:flagellar biosynthesis protein FliQ [Thioalkalivibrio sp.]